MSTPPLLSLGYLLAAVLFVLGLKLLSHPRTAVRGNLLGAAGMLVAVVSALFDSGVLGPWSILAGLLVGGAIGAWLAQTVKMTAMPQMVALLNGFGGAASLLVAGAALHNEIHSPVAPGGLTAAFAVTTLLTGVIGAVTLTGSLIAFAKLQEQIQDVRFGGQSLAKGALLLLVLGAGIWMGGAESGGAQLAYWIASALAAVLGVMLVISIGGADMPVVIALLNSYSGLAAAMAGFVVQNPCLIISGSLVGASGIILCRIMCKAMNRSLANVLFGSFAEESAKQAGDEFYGGKVKSATAEEVALLFDHARKVVIVPGYGMAVSQCQHNVRDFADLLELRGAEVTYAIHPVAGRMPGHMNVLLAEADVPYEQMKEMDEVNSSFEQTDVTLVLGANDIVNPLARTDPKCPIAGMPILNVDKSRTVVVVKRSLSPGFAGIPNPLFAADNTLMMFADGKRGMIELIQAVKGA